MLKGRAKLSVTEWILVSFSPVSFSSNYPFRFGLCDLELATRDESFRFIGRKLLSILFLSMWLW